MLRVEIRWLDTGSFYRGTREDGWVSKNEVLRNGDVYEVTTCGFLFHEDEKAYYVCLTADESNNHYYGVQLIAKEAVRSFTRLRARKRDDDG